jgi:hypothetical protein
MKRKNENELQSELREVHRVVPITAHLDTKEQQLEPSRNAEGSSTGYHRTPLIPRRYPNDSPAGQC